MNTIIEKIRAEMERRIKSWQTRGEHSPEGQGKDTCVSRVTELTDLLSFLDTLQEQPVCEGLEEEIKSFLDKTGAPYHWCDDKEQMDWVGIIARHFAQWQKEQMISALKNDGDLPVEFIDKFHEIDRIAFQNGQENMKVQMMKEAVEGEVTDTCGISSIWIKTKQFKQGEKVKLIIIKEEGK